ncbi:MAG: acyltransferase family protein [Bacteroidota bacterium]
MESTLSPFNSAKFKFWSFISMVLLVFVHGYGLNIRFLQPWTAPEEPLTVTTFIEYFLSNGIFRFRIPMLFIISGFLYAMHDHQQNGIRVKKRMRTLLLPYILWSGIGLLTVAAMELTESGRSIIASTNMMRVDDVRIFLSEYHWYEVLGRWLLSPVPYQLWFIRSLFFYNAAYPLLKRWVNHPFGKKIFFSAAALFWLLNIGFGFFEGEGLLFFSLGIWIQKNRFDIDSPSAMLDPKRWGIIFVSVCAIKTLLAFKGLEYFGDAVYPLLAVLYKLAVISGLIAAWYGGDRIVRWCMERRWFVQLSSFSFMIYAVHVPLITFAIDPALQMTQHLPFHRLLTYIVLPGTVILFSILVGALLRKVFPRFYGLLTGGRGM